MLSKILFKRLKNVGFANLVLVLHKTFWKNVSKKSCKTHFRTFLKSDLKAVAKLVEGICFSQPSALGPKCQPSGLGPSAPRPHKFYLDSFKEHAGMTRINY